jgi:hypothetical protein
MVIKKPFTIAGRGPKLFTISANSASRVFTISDGNLLADSPVAIGGVTLSQGYNGDCVGAVQASGGALGSAESLVLTGVIVRDSFASGNGGGLSWAPTMSGQTLLIQNSQFLNNQVGCNGATAQASGGGLSTGVDAASPPALTATITIQDTLFEANSAVRHGGGMRLTTPGNTTLSAVRAFGNSASVGGGVFVAYNGTSTALPTVLIDSSTILANMSNNNNGIGGGGLATLNDNPTAQTAALRSTVTVRNSTISSNGARNGPAAGISAYGNAALVVQNSTIAFNRSMQATAAPSLAGGIYRQIGVQNGTAAPNLEGSISIESSIVSENIGTIGPDDLGQNPAETFLNPVAINKSLVRTGTLAPPPTGSGNIFDTDPLLLDIDDYGGPTLTHALNPASPAINAGSNPAALQFDQRGFARTVGGAPDMGAYESGNVIPLGCLDVDGNGQIDALTDGLITIRAMFGLTGASVTNAAVGANASRSTWATIRQFLNRSCGGSFAQ